MDVVCPERNQTPDRRIETETREKDPVRLDADKDFLCPICIQPLKDTFLTSCGHSFCYLCITTHLNNRKNCPCCGVYLTTSQLYPNIALNKILKKLSTCQMTNATSPTEQLRLVLQQGAEMSPKEIDSLLIILAQKKRKMEQEEAEVNTEVLLEFLCRLRRQKLEELNEIQGDLLSLKEDISRVENQRLELLKSKEKYLSKWRLPLDRPAALTNISNGGAIVPFVRNGQSGTIEPAQEQRKMVKRKIRNMSPSKNQSNVCLSRDDSLDSDLSSPAGLRAAKKKRVLSQFEQLQDCYLQKCRKYREKHTSEGNIKKEADENSEPMNRMFQGSQRTGLDDFRDILTGFTRYSRMQVVAELRHGGLFQSSNLVSSIEFDRDDELFATAGVSRRIKIFEFSTVVNELADVHCPVMEMPTRSKLSCLSWNKYIKGHIASSDYEGIVTVWDVNTRQSIMEYEEHEKRAWSVDFSRTDPTMLVSGSDDGKVKLWCTRQETSALNIEMKANICSVKYNPGSSNFIAVGSADHNIHYYDLRNSKLPLHVFSGHRKAVSYVKFISPNELASASTDSTLRIWDVQKKSLVRTLSGHRNEKNFVGLTVSSEYLACGSETNEVFVYHKDLPRPAARHKFTSSDMEDPEEDPSHFICAVCWKSESPTMLAANSQGTIKVLVLAP